MNSRERVAAALRREEPDRIPYCELGIDRSLAQTIMGWGESTDQAANLEANAYSVGETKAIAARLQMDNINYVLRAPVYAEKLSGEDGRLFYGEGLIRDEADLARIQLPDPDDDALYAEAEAFIEQKEDFSAWLVTRIGIFPTMLSLGMANFGLALYDNRSFVEAVLDRYCDWAVEMAERACQMGFDVFVSTDDMAFKTGPFFSPAVFREMVLPRFQRVREKITIPWIVHTDGNVMPFLNDLIGLGIAGLHPLEEGAMDIRTVKREFGDRICVLGNVDLNILGLGTPEDVEHTVRELVRDVGPGGGYIVTCGNSLAGYLRPENVVALGQAVMNFGSYPIDLSE